MTITRFFKNASGVFVWELGVPVAETSDNGIFPDNLANTCRLSGFLTEFLSGRNSLKAISRFGKKGASEIFLQMPIANLFESFSLASCIIFFLFWFAY